MCRGCPHACSPTSWPRTPTGTPPASSPPACGSVPAAISGAVRYLVQAGLLGKDREPGVRSDLYRIDDDDVWSRIFLQRSDVLRRYEKAAAEGVEVLGLHHAGGRRMRESQHFFAFLDRELDGLLERWREHRTRLDPHPPDDEVDAEQAREARKGHHR